MRVRWVAFVCAAAVACGSSSPQQPAVRMLVSVIDIPVALGVDGDELVWATQAGDLYFAPKSGSPISGPLHVASFIAEGSQLAFDESAIYVSTFSNGLFRVDRATSEITQIDGGDVTAVATNVGGDVYWSTFAVQSSSPPAVKRLVLDASSPEVLVAGQGSMAIALDSAGVYWFDGIWLDWCVCWDPCDGRSQAPLRQRANDGAISTLAAATPYSGGLAADGEAVYVSDWCAGTITRFDHTSHATSVLASKLKTVNAIAIDTLDVYAVVQGEVGLFDVVEVNPSIVRVPKSGGEASALPIGNRVPTALALDDDTVYFLAYDRATKRSDIFAIAKPRP